MFRNPWLLKFFYRVPLSLFGGGSQERICLIYIWPSLFCAFCNDIFLRGKFIGKVTWQISWQWLQTSRQFETAYDNTFLEESTYDISNSARFRFYVRSIDRFILVWSQISRDQTHCRSWSPCTVEQFNYTLSLSLSFLADREFIWAGFWQGFALFYLCRQKGNKNFVIINKNLHSIRSRAWRITLPFIEKEKKGDTVNTCSVRKFKTPRDTMICFPDVYLVLLPKVKRFHKGRACAFVGYLESNRCRYP